MNDTQGVFVISLDFELLWGVLDTPKPEKYFRCIVGTRHVIPKLLSMFEQYNIHATWGVVGLLMQDNIRNCMTDLPNILPVYSQRNLSSYEHFSSLQEYDHQLLFANDLVEMIRKVKGQEIGTHTYSHYYCLEEGQTKGAFESDIIKAQEITAKYTTHLQSILFPRNQFNSGYAEVMKNNGIINYRGNENAWFYRSCETKKKKSIFRRTLRLMDSYVGLFGNHCYPLSAIKDGNGLNNIRSSRFFRPYSKALAFGESLRIRRICNQMTYAAKTQQVFHLWWHPHNFGTYTQHNFDNLEILLLHYNYLKEHYGMQSLNMEEVGDMVTKKYEIGDAI